MSAGTDSPRSSNCCSATFSTSPVSTMRRDPARIASTQERSLSLGSSRLGRDAASRSARRPRSSAARPGRAGRARADRARDRWPPARCTLSSSKPTRLRQRDRRRRDWRPACRSCARRDCAGTARRPAGPCPCRCGKPGPCRTPARDDASAPRLQAPAPHRAARSGPRRVRAASRARTLSATTMITPAIRPGAGNGASAATAPAASAIQPATGSEAVPQVACGQPAGASIRGQVNSMSEATAPSAAAPASGATSVTAVPTRIAGTMTSV